MGQIMGYARVSSKEQNPARQREALEKKCDKYFEDKLSGKNMERPEFQRMLEQLREGDTVMVLSIDRLGRNTRDLVNIAHDLEKKGVNIVAEAQGIDTRTSMGKLFYTLMAVFAEMELEFIKERREAGINIAKKEGRFKGRPPKRLNEFDEIDREVQEGKLSVNRACRLLNISRSTYYRRKQKKSENPTPQE